MRIRCYAEGKFYTIEGPEGTEVVRGTGPDDRLIVPLNGKPIRIPADPPELLPLLAESGNFGVKLVGEPEPDVGLAGVSCLNCGEADVAWLRLEDGSRSVHCDRCGAEFALPVPETAPVMIRRRTVG